MQQWCGDQALAVLPVPWGQHGSWMGTAASDTVPEWRGKLEGESHPPSWVESWLKITGNENRGNIWVQLLHHFRRARSSCCLWATAAAAPLLRQAASPAACPHRWNRGRPRAWATSHPLPVPRGSPGAGGAGGDRLRCPVRAAPGPPRRPPLMRVSGSSIVAPLCLPRFSRSAQNLPWKPQPAAGCPRKPAGAIRKCK